ncbi:proline-rich extensin-like protein EPR1 [Penaeus japonicus]|uniref:proline-rich extensin-like protein EPR1 n=1 Tax=Penaeus japonicus TaxID=27405 RepID=UPI001C713811|nr:proline-rich extensin-like protein EPR1 [Penaeus japonicus]XP_042869903.1 proline-rich extensin-like protein EPR1 [Penaeus japonicus]
MTVSSLDFVEHGIVICIIIGASACIIALYSCMRCRQNNGNQVITSTHAVVLQPNTGTPQHPYAEQPGYTVIAPLSQNRSPSSNPTAPGAGAFLAKYTYTPINNSTARSYNAPSSIGHYPVGSPSAPAFPVSSIQSSPGYQPPPGISSPAHNETPPYGNSTADRPPEYQPPPPYTPGISPPPYTPDMAPPPYEK